MGRVDDAMRRATETGTDRSTSGAMTALEQDVAFEPEAAPAAAEAATAVEQMRPAVDSVPAAAPEPGPGLGDSAGVLGSKLVGDERMLIVSREQYRRLAATLHHIQATSGLKVVLVASAVAGEGKTLTAANLALTFSESYERSVLLIDADLRRPSLARTFGVTGTPGLTEGLARRTPGPLPLRTITSRLSLLPAGASTTDPMAGLTSQRMREIIDEARQRFDWVIVDTPPIGLMTDANLLSAIADGTVFVIKANSTPYDVVQRAIDALGRESIIGAVLNRATAPRRSDNYYNYYRYSGTDQSSASESA